MAKRKLRSEDEWKAIISEIKTKHAQEGTSMSALIKAAGVTSAQFYTKVKRLNRSPTQITVHEVKRTAKPGPKKNLVNLGGRITVIVTEASNLRSVMAGLA